MTCGMVANFKAKLISFSGGNAQPRNSVYGSTNKAFDPTPETTTPPPPPPVSTFSTPMGIHVDSNGGPPKIKKKSSEDAISDGRPGSDPMADTQSGNSTFYGGGSVRLF